MADHRFGARQSIHTTAMAGAEAVISHLLVRHLQIPCAHAPALSALPLDPQLDPRAAGEELGYTFLACVLVGLSQAPTLVQRSAANSGDLVAADLGVLVVPEGSLGGEAALACLERRVPVISVANPSVLEVTSTALGMGSEVLQAGSYAEAAGMVLALREGVALSALMRPISALKELE